MLAYLLAALIVVIAALLAFGIAALMHLQGLAYILFVVIILVLGIVAAVVIIVMHHRAKKQNAFEGDAASSEAKTELDLLLNDANRKLRDSQQGAKTLEYLPLIYILGDSGSAKTTTVAQSGLEPELLAGAVSQDGSQVPTQILNLWYTRLAAFLEVGPTLRQNNALLARLVHRTRATAYRSAFGTGAPPRAAIVCVSSEQLLQAGSAEPLVSSARTAGAQLREISRILGIPVPVYVILTKLDRVPHFEEYVRNLSDEEVRQVLGASLGRIDSSAGTYADQASRTLSTAVDALVFKLGGFRVEMLDRENDPANISGVYEFPREFGKLRKNLTQYLVELCKPSQLSANPYLRGFYFTGVRARVVERVVAAPAAAQVSVASDAGATQFLNLSAMRASAASQQAAPVATSSRVPQWTFLPRLLPNVILGDKSALTSTRQSAPARLFRRILFGTLAFTFALFTVLILISYFKNAARESRIREDARALQTAGANPTIADLRNLDDLRLVILQLENERQNGRPLLYRFGLYQGKNLEESARRIYFDRFRPMFLDPTQASFVQFLKPLPDAPDANTSGDRDAYNAAYNPLKAYLITTDPNFSTPHQLDKNDIAFLSPVFLGSWTGARQIDSDQKTLAQEQIDFYGSELLRRPPYQIAPEPSLVKHTQFYLSKFGDKTRVYQNMLADADKKNAGGVDFNKQYPNLYVKDGYYVRGAFTREGFSFMQDALQHPDRYTHGETWVLGNQGGPGLDLTALGNQLSAEYLADYSDNWHKFLTNARVSPCGGLREAPNELAALSGPSSPILQLFSLVSHNTAVSDQTIKSVFQPTQVLVDPNATDRLIGAGNNKDYITALGSLGLTLDQTVKQNPAIGTDPAAFGAQIGPLILTAKGAVQTASQSFNPDKDTHTDKLVAALMSAPIDCVNAFAPSPGAAANGGGAKICSAIDPLLGKFPFSKNQQPQASLPEVDAVFAPDNGALWTTYAAMLKPFLIQTGPQSGAAYAQAPNPPQALNPRFVLYFNHAAHVSNSLYAPGQTNSSLSFNLRFLPGSGVKSANLVVDGQPVQSGSTFTWNGKTANSAFLTYDGNNVLQKSGTWALFELIRQAVITRTATGYHLDYRITIDVAGERNDTGKVATFELSGPGADLLVGDAFTGLGCVRPAAK